MEPKRLNPAIISLIVVALIAVAGGTVYVASSGKNDSEQQQNEQQTSNDSITSDTSTTNNVASTTDSSTTSSSYQDGDYSATGSYTTPGGQESISVTVTLTSGKITAVSAKGSASGGESAQYQSAFLSGYKSKVVGKSIDEVSLSRVSGSSLTSNGFNRAIETIKDDAQS